MFKCSLWRAFAVFGAILVSLKCCPCLPRTTGPGETLPDWEEITEQPCNLGMQDMYRKPFYTENRPFAICGKYNEETGLDLAGRPCCCEFCGQRDPFGQLCEISQKVCSTIEDCIQRHHGVCKSSKRHKGVDRFFLFWCTILSFLTIMPFVIPAIAMYAAEELVLGLAG